MRKILGYVLPLLWLCAVPAWSGPGVQWETSWAAALAKARASHKPILLLHLFGHLDDEFC